MYEKTFGLKAKPFRLLPDPTYLFQSRAHQLAQRISVFAKPRMISIDIAASASGGSSDTRQSTSRFTDGHPGHPPGRDHGQCPAHGDAVEDARVVPVIKHLAEQYRPRSDAEVEA